MRNGFCYYENGRPERINMRKAYRMFQTEVSEEQKNQGDYFFHLAFRNDQNADFLLTHMTPAALCWGHIFVTVRVWLVIRPGNDPCIF